MSCFDSIINKSDIDNKCCITVEGYIRQHLEKITAVIMPMCVSDIILFFYAKPMYIRILNKSQMITILYCEAIDCWSSLYNKIKYKFNYNLLPYNFRLSYDGKTITKKEWNTFNFKEYDIFIINPFILPQQWDLIIATMALTMTPQQQYRTFCKLKKITNNLITRNNPRYRTLHLNSRLTDDGFLEFLYHLGFVGRAQDIRICHDVNDTVIQACLTSLQHKIEILSYRTVPKNKNLNRNPITPLQSQTQNDKQTKTNHFYIVKAYIRLQTAYYNIFIPTDIIDLIHFMFDDHILKTFIFIRHGNVLFGRCKSANPPKRYSAKFQVGIAEYLHGRRNPTNDHWWVIDAPLSKIGINDSIALKTFLAKHLKLSQLKTVFKTQISQPIHNVLQIINEEILNKYENELMQSGKVDLFNKCQQIGNIMQSVYDQIQNSMLQTGITSKNGIVNESNDFSGLDDNYFEQLLDLEWVLDRMVSDGNSIVASSPLKRAINTTLIALWDRFSANKEHLHILPCLQEIGMGIDIYSQNIPVIYAFEISDFEKVSKKINVNELKTFYENRLLIDGSILRGYENAPDTQNRLHYFCDWAFKQNNENGLPYNTIIACGHSHWIRAFFKTFLPKNTECIATKRKLYNCGVVAFKMISYSGHKNQRIYEIVEKSITTIYKGFC